MYRSIHIYLCIDRSIDLSMPVSSVLSLSLSLTLLSLYICI